MNYQKSNEEYSKQLRLTGNKLAHFLVTVAIFYIFWLLFRYGTLVPMKSVGYRYNYFITIGYAIVLFFFNRTYNSYLLGYTRIRTLASSESLSQIFSIVLVYIAVTIGWNKFRSPLYFIPMLFVQLIWNCLWAYQATGYYFKLYAAKKTILIYRNELDKKRFGSIKGKPSERIYQIAEEFRYEGKSFVEIRPRLEGYEAVFVAGVDSRCRNGISKYCKEKSIPGFFLPHVGDVIMQEAMHIQSFDSPVLYVTRTQARPEYAIIKRGFDCVSSLLAICILSPVMLVTAIAIKVCDRGPILYKQVRLTKDGKEFEIWKFRSMRVDAEKDGVARLSTGDKDDRITPVGRVIRTCRIDEIPQLFNILKGDMSVVGPRPERPEIAEQYYQTIPDFKLRLQVKAGLTGYAQVYGKYNTDPYEKLEFDLLYINNMSVFTDVRLIFATFSILFSRESTTGVESGAITAIDYEEKDNASTDRIKDVTQLDTQS